MAATSRFARIAAMLVTTALIALNQPAAQAAPRPHPASGYTARAVVPSPTAIDTSNRQAVIDAFRSRWIPAYSTPDEVIGAAGTCTAGEPSAQVMTGALNMVNFARDMVGSPQVVFTPEKNQLAQQASLVMAASGVMTHYPDPSMACYTEAGAQGARESNIASGYRMGNGATSVRLWLGSSKGHRDWVLHPGVLSMGFGAVTMPGATSTGASALHVIDPGTDYRVGGGIPWPVVGYFPEELIGAAEAWNYAFPSGDPAVETNAASVTLTRLTPGGPVNVPVTVQDPGKYSSRVYFTPQEDWLRPTAAGSDVTYEVRISGLMQWMSGNEADYLVPVPDVVYTTTLITARAPGTGPEGLPLPDDTDDDDTDDEFPTSVTLTAVGKVKIKGLVKGSAKVGRRLTVALPRFNRPVATTVRWYRSGKVVAKAKSLKYTPKHADVRKRLQVKVTATWKGQRLVLNGPKIQVVR